MQARRRCRSALVATGQIRAAIEPPDGGRFTVSTPLSVFNGPRIDGGPSVLVHAHLAAPWRETHVLSLPILPGRRDRGFNVKVDIPELAGGYGYLIGTSLRVHRLYRHRGRRLSYAMARCPDHFLAAQGRFEFADKSAFAGTLFKYCAKRR